MNDNKYHATLLVVAICGLASGILIAGISTGVYHQSIEQYGSPEFGGDPLLLSTASGWQVAGLIILAIGALSFIAAGVTGSISHDLRVAKREETVS